MKIQIQFLLLTIVILCGCQHSKPKDQSKTILAVDSSRKTCDIESIETVITDLNFDGKNDTIFITSPAASNDPGEFYTTIISLSGIGRQEFTGKDVWDHIDSTFLSNNHNAVESKRIFVYKEKRSTILLFFGYCFGTGREFAILRVDGNNVQTIFDQDLNEVITIGDVDKDGQANLVGRQTYEIYSDVDSLDAFIGTYSPFLIYTIGKTVYINESLSKKYNEDNYVWAGINQSDVIKVLYPKKEGKPILLTDD